MIKVIPAHREGIISFPDHGEQRCSRRRKGTFIRAKISKEFLLVSLGQDFSGAINSARKG